MRVAIVVSLLLAGAVQAQPPLTQPVGAPDARAGIIRGRVFDAATRQPVRKATIRARTASLREPLLTVTDRDGGFELGGLTPGAYALTAEKRNYLPQPFGRSRAQDPPQEITVAAAEAVDAQFSLRRAAVIGGLVVDEVGEPVDAVTVSVLGYQYTASGRSLRTVARSQPTNDLGEYRIAGLRPGRYFLSATLPGAAEVAGLTEHVLDRRGYAPTFYPGTGDVGLAERVSVQAGDVALGRDLVVRPVPMASVRGRAVTASGAPLATRRVTASSPGADLDPITATTTAPDGTFVLRAMPAGAYVLRVAGDREAGDAAGAIRLALSDSDLDGIEIVAPPPTLIRGRVRLQGASATPPNPARFQVRGMTGAPDSLAGGQAIVQRDFSFQLSSAPGAMFLRIESPLPDWTLERVRIDGVDVTDRAFEVPATKLLANVDVLLTNTDPVVAVEVVDAAGRPVRDCQVIVFARDRARWSFQSRFVTTGRPVAGSRFEARVPAGEYYVAAVDDVAPGEWFDAQFLGELAARADAVQLVTGERTSIRVQLPDPQ